LARPEVGALALRLVQLAQTDTSSGKPLGLVYQDKINELSGQLKKKTSMTIILSTTTLILLIYVLIIMLIILRFLK
jgi:hypothetical protein